MTDFENDALEIGKDPDEMAGSDNDSGDSENESGEVVNTGYCSYCGDGVLVGEYAAQADADAAATERCTCKDAAKARKAAEKAAAEEEDPPRSRSRRLMPTSTIASTM